MLEWRTRLLDEASIPPSQIHALDDSVPLERSAAAYEAEVLNTLGGSVAASGGSPPVFDAVVLGMGPDGHTASLFPGHPLLGEAARWVAPIGDSPKPPPGRITLTLPVLNSARRALFVVTGGSKSAAVQRAFSPDAPDAPAGRVFGTVHTHWLMDGPAAAELRREVSKADHLYG